MLALIGRMNPRVCLCGSSGALNGVAVDDTDDDVTATTATDDSSKEQTNRRQASKQQKKKSPTTIVSSGGGGCVAPCSSRYQPDDTSEPLASDVIFQSLNRTVPDLLACISSAPPTAISDEGASPSNQRKAIREYNTKRTESLEKLHDLTKKGKEYNRIPLCCCSSAAQTKSWDVIGVLANALLDSTEQSISQQKNTIDGGNHSPSNNNSSKPNVDEDCRLICWTINNLSIPYENKLSISLGEHASKLLHALTSVIASNLPESYLCCITLYNLTFMAEAIRPVIFYVPSVYGDGVKAPYSPSRRTRSASSSTKKGIHSDSHNMVGSGSGKPPVSPLSKSRSLQRIQNRSTIGTNLWSEGEGRISEICGLVLGNSSSLLRVIEQMMIINAPFLLSTVKSVQGEAIRWACGFIRNVTFASGDDSTDDNATNKQQKQHQPSDSLSGSSGRQGTISNEAIEEISLLISQTQIPHLMVQFIHGSPHKPIKWTRDSLEDICLGAMCNLAQWQSSRDALERAGAIKYLEKIEGLPGIHGYRARAIRCSLGALPKQFG